MKNTVLSFAAVMAISAAVSFAQSPPETVDITHAQIEAVQKAGAARTPPAVDQTLRVVDMGNYQLSVGVIHRGPTVRPANAGRGAAGRGRGTPPPAEPCGLAEAPAGAELSSAGMIAHDKTVETYVVISGSGTLVTGGQIVKGRRSGPDSEVTKILNGPSCSGRSAGNIVSRKMVVGDIAIIPAGVPHGWTDITDHVDYLSVRPDPDKVLEHGYVNPTIAAGK